MKGQAEVFTRLLAALPAPDRAGVAAAIGWLDSAQRTRLEFLTPAVVAGVLLRQARVSDGV